MTDASVDLLSQIIVFQKYAKHKSDLNRRESWEELAVRNMEMHLVRFPHLQNDILSVYRDFVLTKKVLPSMRSLQFGGKAIHLSPNRGFNCSYAPMDHYKAFPELMFLLLGGTGVGYSVQKHHVAKLPMVTGPNGSFRYMIQDSIVGWSDAVKVLFKSYFFGTEKPEFDYRDIRAKGSELKTSGGKAPGPDPLRKSLENCESILKKAMGGNLTPLQVHDLCCFIADAVLSGGIRRAAMISFFSLDDEEMLHCKDGVWYEANGQRARSNNSAVLVRGEVNEVQFKRLWETISSSESGEPGIYWTNDREILSNPCGEISLRPFQFCNLSTFNVSDVDSQEELEARAKAAAFLGTLQAAYTDFHYLRPIWRETTEKDSLLGVSMTGIASGKVLSLDLTAAAEVVKEENVRVANAIGIRPAARTTCVKPEGTASLVVGSSSGIHAWHAPHYIRRVRINKQESLYKYLLRKVPALLEDDVMKPDVDAVLSVPIKAPEGAVFRNESAMDFLSRVQRVTTSWIHPGHRDGVNTHNVSATVSIRPEEWASVGEWMWANSSDYSGLSVLPFWGGNYAQMPYEDCDEVTYHRLMQHLAEIDLSEVDEVENTVNHGDVLACSGGSCEIN
jgi:ribonucleoside-triphosphate reductase (thioredoxin)